MLLCPSMMCGNIQDLKSEIIALENAKVDMFHCDVMDGHFVTNMSLGLEDVKAIKTLSSIPIDIHLMVENPSSIIDIFIKIKPNIIYIHFESERYVNIILNKIRKSGIRSGLAINPDTSVSTIREVLPYCDDLLVMSVNPGFKGQSFLKTIDHKINELIKLKAKFGFRIFMDGACSSEVIKKYSKLGVDGFVLGTASLFNENYGKDYSKTINKIRGLV